MGKLRLFEPRSSEIHISKGAIGNLHAFTAEVTHLRPIEIAARDRPTTPSAQIGFAETAILHALDRHEHVRTVERHPAQIRKIATGKASISEIRSVEQNVVEGNK